MADMTLEEAKDILNRCHRHENRDHSFGDREIYWTVDGDINGEELGCGYFGGGYHEVTVTDLVGETHYFKGQDAYDLVKCGKVINIGRNDMTGPGQYEGA